MQIVSALRANARLLAAGVIGVLAFAAGCDSGGNPGESTVAPATPPPGKSGEARKKAIDKAFGRGGNAGKEAKPEKAAP
jgi:hypothetical protein